MVNQQPPSGSLGPDVAVTHILVVADPARSRDFGSACWARNCTANTGDERGAAIRRYLALAGQWRRPDRRQAHRGLPAAPGRRSGQSCHDVARRRLVKGGARLTAPPLTWRHGQRAGVPGHPADGSGHHRPAGPGRVLPAAIRPAVPAGR